MEKMREKKASLSVSSLRAYGLDEDLLDEEGVDLFLLETFTTLAELWQAVRAGLGIGFVSEHLIRTDSAVVPVLPKLGIRPLPVWLAVHKEVRTSTRIRAVYDFLSDALPGAL